MDDKQRIEELREISGHISYSDPLTDFLYLLMRNELAAGKVEEMVREAINTAGKQECIYTNGWLAQYAHNLAELLKNAHNGLLDAAVKDKTLNEKEIEELEKQIENAYKKDKSEESITSTIEDVKNVVEQLRISGGLTDYDAKQIEEDLKNVSVGLADSSGDIERSNVESNQKAREDVTLTEKIND